MFKTMTRAYQKLIFYGGFLKSPLLFLLRLYWGASFIHAGWEKLSDISKFADFLQNLHFPFPLFMAYAAGLIEFLGGVCLLVGFASRLAAIPLIIVMVLAYLTVHTESLRLLFQRPGAFVSEAPFNYLLTALFVLTFGPGRFSLDYMIEKYLFSRAEEIPKHQHLSK